MPSDPILVLLGPTAWEGPFVAALAHPGAGLTFARRCLDTADLLAAASAGLGRAVVLGADVPRLDADVVMRLSTLGLPVVGVVTAGDDRAVGRLQRFGVGELVEVDAAAVGIAARDTARAVDALLRTSSPHDVVAAGPEAIDGHGRVVTVWGPAGAPGRTTVAVALADEAARAGMRVLLVDADTWAPSVSIALGLLDDGAGLASACRRALGGALDASTLTSICREAQPGFIVLAGIPRASRWTEVRQVALAEVLDVARSCADLVVVDVAAPVESDEELVFDTDAPRRNAATITALEVADKVVVVGGCDPVALVRLVGAVAELHDTVPGLDPVVVVTRVRESVVGRRPAAAISEALHRHAGIAHPWCVPDDLAVFDAALRTGRTVAEVGSSSKARSVLRAVLAEVTAGGPVTRATDEDGSWEADRDRDRVTAAQAR